MGSSFSTVEYREMIIKFQTDSLTPDDNEKLKTFFL